MPSCEQGSFSFTEELTKWTVDNYFALIFIVFRCFNFLQFVTVIERLMLFAHIDLLLLLVMWTVFEVGFAGFSYNSHLAAKVKFFGALAPVAQLGGVTSVIRFI